MQRTRAQHKPETLNPQSHSLTVPRSLYNTATCRRGCKKSPEQGRHQLSTSRALGYVLRKTASTSSAMWPCHHPAGIELTSPKPHISRSQSPASLQLASNHYLAVLQLRRRPWGSPRKSTGRFVAFMHPKPLCMPLCTIGA